MPEDFRNFTDKTSGFAHPGNQVNIGTQIHMGQKRLLPTKLIPDRGSVHFVGREQELAIVHQELQQGNNVAVVGMEGVGKTELVTQYARQYEDVYGGIAWFNASQTNLTAEILQLFRLQFGLEIPQESGRRLLSLNEQVAWCWSKYPESSLPILIIFDNVTDLANLREVVPTEKRFRVLVTTKLRYLDPHFIQEISLNVLSPQKEPGKALELFQKLLGEQNKRIANEPEAAAAICEFLRYFPLGIELVGGYLVQNPELSLDNMFRRLQDQKLADAAFQQQHNLSSSQRGVKTAFALTWSELDPLAQQLGKLLSLFSPELVLWDLVVWIATRNGEPAKQEQHKQLSWSEDELNKAKKQLCDRNLLQQVKHREKCYEIHSLLRLFLQEQLAASGEMKLVLEKIFTNHAIAIAKTIPDSLTLKDVKFFKAIIPYLEDLGRRLIVEFRETPVCTLVDEFTWVFVGIGKFYKGQGLYKLAEPWYEECLKICQALFTNDHPDLATSLNGLAELYCSQRRYTEAEPLYTEALVMRNRLYEGDHPDLAQTLNGLARLYKSQRQYSEAEPLYTEALAIRKRLYAGDHLDLAQSLNSLASIYKIQGRYSEAEPLYTEALAIRKRLYEDDHPDVAQSLNSLASIYKIQGRYSEAEPLYTEALAIRKRLYEGDNPDIAQSLNNLALLYNSQARYSEAEPLYIAALAMRKRLYEHDHPDVAQSLNNLASLYNSQGRYAEAELLFQEALEMRKHLYEGDNPDVATSLNNLASLYRSQGRYAEAKPLLQEALVMCERVLGVDHPWTVKIRENLTILQHQHTSASVWMRSLGCGQILFSLPWSLVKSLTLIFRRLG
ncbi:tetratricopeptide repeat protein [Fischerella sp. JS2]|uniref:tetratricopeptide repeat protein n=1 Tax=Fischerella sp. JS2 TaxID=2597771 RepID=UPI0028EE9BA6|nr:tetratricopeptide repeat protein [Fischerella sp. JS2]